MWLIVGQMPIKAGWWDVSLDVSRINKALHPVLYNKYNLYLSLRYCNVHISEAVVPSCSLKKRLIKILQNSQVFLWHRSFLWILRHFKEHHFSQSNFCGCFWHLHKSRFSILILYVTNQQLRREYVYFLSMVEQKISFSHVFSSK